MARGIEVDGKIIKRHRAAKAWSQLDLAHQAGVALPTVSRLERGYPATTDIIEKVADALGVEPEKLTAPTEDAGEALLALVEGKARELRQATGTGEVSSEMVLRTEWLLKDVERYAGPLIGNGRITQAIEDLWLEVAEAWKVTVHASAGLEPAPVKSIKGNTRRARSQRGREVKSA